jgi:hypothetical protein
MSAASTAIIALPETLELVIVSQRAISTWFTGRRPGSSHGKALENVILTTQSTTNAQQNVFKN